MGSFGIFGTRNRPRPYGMQSANGRAGGDIRSTAGQEASRRRVRGSRCPAATARQYQRDQD